MKRKEKKKKTLDIQVEEGKQVSIIPLSRFPRTPMQNIDRERKAIGSARARDAYAVTEKSKLDQPPSGSARSQQKKSGFTLFPGIHDTLRTVYSLSV